jgi:hypothetical protein
MSESVAAAQQRLDNAQAQLRRFDAPLSSLKTALDKAVASKDRRSIEYAEAAYVAKKNQDSSDRKVYIGAVTSAQNRLATAKANAIDTTTTVGTTSTTESAPTVTTSAPAQITTAPAAVPPPPPEPPDPPIFKAVKAAPIDTVLFVDEKFSQEFMTDLLFEDVAGQELLSIARDDTVNGQEVIYQPIKNLGILRDIYDINNLLKLQETSDRFFANFLINLFQKIPIVGNGPNGKNYYFDEDLGDIIIDFVNMRDDEQVEIQISNAGIIEQVGI